MKSRTTWDLGLWIGVIVIFVPLLQLTNGQKQSPRIVSQPPKFSSKFNSNSHRRPPPPIRDVTAEASDHVDYSNGFPSGFTQGLPNFDFSGSMDASNRDQTSADTENVGFVHGPPKGFPTLEQLGGDFPNFGGSTAGGEAQHTPSQSQQTPYRHPQGPLPHHGHGSESHEGDEYLSGPGPSSVHNPIEVPRPGRRPAPHRLNKRPPPHHQQVAGSSGNLHYVQTSGPHLGPPPHHPHVHQPPHHHHSRPKKPVVLKVSGKNGRPVKLPPPPPPFYAPSPDLVSSHKNNPNQGQQYRGDPEYASSQQYNQRHRYRRAAEPKKDVTEKAEKAPADDLLADGSEPETFWELTSPFILFDTYHNNKPEEAQPAQQARSRALDLSGSNITFSDPEGGEQRFFPSYPAPYLGLGPFGARPPVFPGPAANRSPSRYHPQQFGHGKYAQASAPPNRGPSGVYSAESHDHGDRYQDNNLLGSGNFEVVRGGTYYEDEDAYHAGFHGGDHHGGGHHGEDGGDYYPHNGHSSSPGYRVPGSDFFANFRDFADINPPARAFSHNHETLTSFEPEANGNRRSSGPHREPKNILDKLQSSSDVTPVHHALSRESDPMMATF